ncbi:MAG TPA: DUF885 family protein [Steroidobacteraceae bacterium]|nr:DUF885 family protein [Steroidobacteraceae bacterium]
MRAASGLAVIAAALALASCAALRPSPPEAKLERLVQAYFDEWLALNPTTATDIGDHRFDDQRELSPALAHETASVALETRYRTAVDAIDPATLDDDARLTREMFLYGRDMVLERRRHPRRLLPISQFDGGLATDIALYGSGAGAQPFATIADYDRWLVRAGRFPLWVDAAIAAMRESMASGIVHPRAVMAKTVPQLESLIAADVEASIFYGPVGLMSEDWPAAERGRLEAAIRNLIEQQLNPSYRRLADFIRDEYLPACRETVGWSALPGGTDTTTALAPADIHAIRPAEVACYIVNPGQALGYKIGDLRIQALRRRAEETLGTRFDVREFHAAVLADGALPLEVLERKIARWIDSRR